jgi:diguanylate cyclase (GGDEF)-like protein
MDVVGRWGGEEFLILLPETSLDEAAVLVERLRMAVAESPCHVDEHGTVRNVTISIGVTFLSTKTAEMRLPGLIERLLKEADAALYVAKQVRNRVEIFHG